VHKNESGVLFVRIAKQEQLVFSASVSEQNEVDMLFPDGRRVLFPAMRQEEAGEPIQPQAQEVKKPPEHPAITIEGNPVFKHKYNEEIPPLPPYSYLLRLAHHIDPKHPAAAQFYNIIASGEKAKEFYGLYITDTRMQLHITGSDITETVKKHKGTAGIIEADSIEIIHGRRASPEIKNATKEEDLQQRIAEFHRQCQEWRENIDDPQFTPSFQFNLDAVLFFGLSVKVWRTGTKPRYEIYTDPPEIMELLS
jgi:hypothetical protein